MCELHAVIIGLIEYIIRSCLYLYIRTLRNSDLVRADGRPLVSDAQLSRIARRLQERFREAQQCLVQSATCAMLYRWKSNSDDSEKPSDTQEISISIWKG